MFHTTVTETSLSEDKIKYHEEAKTLPKKQSLKALKTPSNFCSIADDSYIPESEINFDFEH